MKHKSKLLNWYHLYIDLVPHSVTNENFKNLQNYLIDKKKEFKLTSLYQASYDDHIHLLFSLPPEETAGQIAGKLVKAIAWFLTAQVGESYDLNGKYALITISPNDVKGVIDYLSDHIDLHLQKKVNVMLERTLKQWSEWEKGLILKIKD